MPRRNQFRIVFSNCPNLNEKKQDVFSGLGAKVIKEVNKYNDFNVLVTDEFKRRVKTLVALNQGYHIIKSSWVDECLRQKMIVPFEGFEFDKVDAGFAKKQGGFNLKKAVQKQIELSSKGGVLYGISFYCPDKFENIRLSEIKLLVESAGGVLSEKSENAKRCYTLVDSDY